MGDAIGNTIVRRFTPKEQSHVANNETQRPDSFWIGTIR